MASEPVIAGYETKLAVAVSGEHVLDFHFSLKSMSEDHGWHDLSELKRLFANESKQASFIQVGDFRVVV